MNRAYALTSQQLGYLEIDMYKNKKVVEVKEVRTVRVKVSLTAIEAAALDARRGRFGRAAWLRMSSAKSIPPVVPELNREAWLTLSRVSGSLATLAGDMRGGQYIESSQIREHLSSFRAALLTAEGTFISSDDSPILTGEPS